MTTSPPKVQTKSLITRNFSIPKDLYPYQKEDYLRILRDGPNFLLLSEMGVGKTPIALAVAQEGGFQRTLVVCPKTLQLEWRRQIRDWTGIDPSVSRRGCYRRLETLFDYEMGKRSEPSPFFIVNYETFRSIRHRDILERYPFNFIIMDEAHKLRNPKTKQTRGMLSFLDVKRAVPRLLLTGSPIVNNPADLHTLLCMVRPSEYSIQGRLTFLEHYCYLKKGYRGAFKVVGLKNMEQLQAKTAPFSIRRTKEEVLPFLPEKYIRKVYLRMNKDQKKAYRSMEKELFITLDEGEGNLTVSGVLALLIRLRQLNLDPRILGVKSRSSKTEFLLDLIDQIVTPPDEYPGTSKGEKLVIFSCFETYIRYLDYALGIPHVTITGKETLEQRQAAVKRFQEDPNCKIAMGTIQCMGEGITLTAASNVILMDQWWNPSVNSQAISRLHRISQKNAVQVIIPINEFSIDESLNSILAAKESMIQGFLQEEDLVREVIEDRRRKLLLDEEEDDDDDGDDD